LLRISIEGCGVMSALCKDCGMDTEPWPPRRGTQERHIVKDEVWQAAGMPPGKSGGDDGLSTVGGGILCVGCIEKRLGRPSQRPPIGGAA
jgi:hypothetical protein